MDGFMKNGGKHTVGIYMEGSQVQLVCLRRSGKRTIVVHKETAALNSVSKEAVVNEAVVESEELGFGDEATFTLESAPDEQPYVSESDLQLDENSEVLSHLFNQLPGKKHHAAIAVPEPYIYYSYFYSDWNLTGKKLKDKVIVELSRDRSEDAILTADAVHLIKLADGRLMAIARDQPLDIFNIFETIKNHKMAPAPRTELVVTAEIALVNLVNRYYTFGEEEISILINVGVEASRLIFLKGNEIYHISNIISSGLDTDSVALTIYSRILLEQDNLNLHQIDHILLSGEAGAVGLQNLLVNKFQRKTNINFVEIQEPGLEGDPEELSRYAVALGAAIQHLSPPAKPEYQVDLTPSIIREQQKHFKLSIPGWVLLGAIPLLTFYATYKIVQQEQELAQKTLETRSIQTELSTLDGVEEQFKMYQDKIGNYQKALSIVDSLTLGSKSGSNFLTILTRQAKKQGAVWVTEVVKSGNGNAIIKGYSLYRNRIPVFAEGIGGAVIRTVEVQDIREREVYRFELQIKVPEK